MKHRAAKIAIFVSLFFPFGANVHAEMVVQTCFSPAGRCSHRILREIENAQQEILIAVYAFTSDELARAVVQAKQRGVAVQVILDRDFHAKNEKSKGVFLEQQKVAVRRISGMRPAVDKEPGLMHQKFAVIDRRTVLTGSYNWTQSADSLNDENLLLFRDARPLADEYRKAFFQLWERKS